MNKPPLADEDVLQLATGIQQLRSADADVTKAESDLAAVRLARDAIAARVDKLRNPQPAADDKPTTTAPSAE